MSRLREIEGYDGYFISDEGEVFSDKYNTRRKLSKRKNSRGYYYVNLCKNGKYKSVGIHRLVGKHFVENPNPKMFTVLNHIDGNKLNNSYKNLEWCTVSHNSREAVRLGLIKPRRGKDSNLYGRYGTNMTFEIANEIRKRRQEENLSYNELARIYKMSKATMINICKNRIYTE